MATTTSGSSYYGVTPYRPIRPVATAPLGQYAGSTYTPGNVQFPTLARAASAPAAPAPNRFTSDTFAPTQALSSPGVNNAGPAGAAPPPVAPNVYDITTDPALQAITALTGRSDQDAQAAALKQETGQVLGYGDPTLAASVLGANDPNVQAAAQNPTSTLASSR